MEHALASRPELTARIERLIGAKISSSRRVKGGYTPALRLLCRTSSTSFFVKVGATPLTCTFLRREMDVYTRIRGDFMPRLIASEDHETAPLLIIEDLSEHHWPPPWNEERVAQVLAQIETMHNTPALLEPFGDVHGSVGSDWETIAADPKPFLSLGMVPSQWLETALPLLIDHARQCRTEGSSLTHLDLRSDNICLTQSRAVLVDWNLACLSNPRLDLGFWLPSLAYEGGPNPETILADAPEVAAAVSGFFAARAGLPQIPDAPRVRQVQREQLEQALPWAIRALGLPPPVAPSI